MFSSLTKDHRKRPKYHQLLVSWSKWWTDTFYLCKSSVVIKPASSSHCPLYRSIASSDVTKCWRWTWLVGFRRWWIAPSLPAAASVTAISTCSTRSSVGSRVSRQRGVSLARRYTQLQTHPACLSVHQRSWGGDAQWRTLNEQMDGWTEVHWQMDR